MTYKNMKALLNIAVAMQITIATVSDLARLNNTLKSLRG